MFTANWWMSKSHSSCIVWQPELIPIVLERLDDLFGQVLDPVLGVVPILFKLLSLGIHRSIGFLEVILDLGGFILGAIFSLACFNLLTKPFQMFERSL